MGTTGSGLAVNQTKVFISYSHDSSEHNERVLQFANALRSHGVDAELDRYHVRPLKGWPHWCEEQLRPENSGFVLMICTETYLKRVQDKVPADEGRGVFWEGAIIYNYLYDAKGNTRFIPVLFSDENDSSIPVPIRNHTCYRIGAFDLTDPGYQNLYRELTGQPLVTKPPLGEVINLAMMLAATVQPLEARPVKTDFPTIKADISRIFKYAPAKLIGRDDELELLSEAWAKVQNDEKGRPHILTLVALGGEGKTALVAKWAAELAAQDWPGCDAAFAWSFYSQGTREQQAASSDLFLREALTFFGDKETAESNKGAFEKGQRLARLVGQRRSLLILDGLEPLQYAPTAPTPGELKDQGIAALLKGLAQNSHGLCIVTTRYSLPDLKAFWQTTAPEEKLLRLSRDAGVHLLKTLGVKGSELRNISLKDGDEKSEKVNEFEKLVEDVKGHALTLTLLGSYLRDAHEGDIRKRDLVRLEEADAEEQGGHAFRVMEAYEHAFGREGYKGKRALAILRLLGLFDRPMTADCFGALLQPPAISGLTEPLISMTEAQLNIALSRLESVKLITTHTDDSAARKSQIVNRKSVDAHPLVREYFARQLRGQQPDAWRAAHRRLYEHLCASTKEGDQPTLEDLQPLYQAVAHGCQAGLQQKACDDVYRDRILRGKQHYTWHMLGAYSSELGAHASFFETPWNRLSSSLTEVAQAWLLNEAAFCLRALGRLIEALEPMRAAIEPRVKLGQFDQAAIATSNLSELELMLGEVAGAVGDAEQSVTYADRSGDAFERMADRGIHANALHQAGRRPEAQTRFREAEQMQQERQPDYPLLYSLGSFLYCDLLLAAPEQATWRLVQNLEVGSQKSELIQHCRSVSQRAAQTLKIAERNNCLLDIALDHLTLARAALYEAILEGRRDELRKSPSSTEQSGTRETRPSNFETARRELDTAVSALRRAGTMHDIPHALLARAWLRFLDGACTGPESAQADLDEAWEIAERGPMRLFLADIHLHRARLFFREERYPWESPAADLAAARKLIEQCGYWRRKEELEDAEGRLSQQCS